MHISKRRKFTAKGYKMISNVGSDFDTLFDNVGIEVITALFIEALKRRVHIYSDFDEYADSQEAEKAENLAMLLEHSIRVAYRDPTPYLNI